jgi:type VI secretion system secreted protein Hcp
MSLDIFLKVDGIPGESHDRAHADEMDVVSFTWGAANAGSGDTGGGGGGAGKVQIRTLDVVKRIDKASPKLFLSCASGQHIKQCILAARGTGASFEFMSVKLTDCVIASFTDSGSHDAGTAQETVGIGFAKLDFGHSGCVAEGMGDALTEGWREFHGLG